MRALLHLAAVVSLIWAVFLIGFKTQVFPPQELTPLTRALANGLGIANLVFAYVFWYGAGAPATSRGIIYCALILFALKTGNDVYELLALLPGNQALVSLADLVFSLGLLVGILEALPATLRNRSKPD